MTSLKGEKENEQRYWKVAVNKYKIVQIDEIEHLPFDLNFVWQIFMFVKGQVMLLTTS